MGGTSVRRSRSATRALGALVAVTVLLSGCSLDQDEVDRSFADAPEVLDAGSSCVGFECTLALQIDLGAEPEQITEALGVARGLDPDLITVSLMESAHDYGARRSWQATVDPDDPDDHDEALGQVLAWGARTPEVETLEIDFSDQGARVDVRPAEDHDLWSLGEAAWEAASALPDPSLDLTVASGSADGLDRRLQVSGELPVAALALVRDLEAAHDRPSSALALTGLVVEPEQVLVGVPGTDAVAAAREAVDSHPDVDRVPPVEVAVTDEVLGLALRAEEDRAGATRIVELVSGTAGVRSARLGLNGVEVQLETGLTGAAEVVALVRREAAEELATTRVDLLADEGDVRVEILAEGDDALLDLGQRILAESPAVRGLEISQDRGEPPYVGMVASGRSLGPLVTRVAMILASHRGDSTGYELWAEVGDPAGRSTSAGWTVSVTVDGPEVTDVRGTDERAAELRAAWARGLRGQ